MEVNKVDVGTETKVFVFTAPLQEGGPEVQHPTRMQQHISEYKPI